MKPKTVLIYILLLVALGAAILVYQSDSTGITADMSDCVQVEETALGNLSGWLVFESRKDDRKSFVLHLSTGEKEDLANLTVNTTVGPSKAGELIYYDYLSEVWVLRDLQAGEESAVNELASVTPIAWMNDGRLLVGGDRLLVLDLKSGETENVIPDASFSKIEGNINWASKLNWGGYSPYRVVPEESLMYLTFAANGEPGVSLALWDQEAEREVARLHWADVLNAPQWAPDGTKFVSSAPPFVFYEGNVFTNVADDLPYAGGVDLMQVGIDGSVRRLTTFTARVKAIENRYTWSPDGKDLAFDLEFKSDNGDIHRVAVLDVESGEVTTFCLPVQVSNMNGFPVWSPDGRKLALTLSDKDNFLQTYVIDVESGKAMRIEVDVQVVGWWGN